LHHADKFIVDDIPPIYSTIGDIVAEKKSPRQSAKERIIAIPIGMAICDIALGHLALTRAREKGVGQRFALS
jgi:ornithine cyclodeaminase/alanine dehydrogenase-like protein (mu-crystallin family)